MKTLQVKSCANSERLMEDLVKTQSMLGQRLDFCLSTDSKLKLGDPNYLPDSLEMPNKVLQNRNNLYYGRTF